MGIELAPAVEHLIGSYPKWTKVEELPVEQLEERMKVYFFNHSLWILFSNAILTFLWDVNFLLQVVGDLWERGILMTSEPLEAHYDDPWTIVNRPLLHMHSPHPKIFIQIMFLQRVKFPDPLFFKMPPRREKKQGSTMGEVSDLSVVFVVGDDQSLT